MSAELIDAPVHQAMPLGRARHLAEQIASRLAPYCQRLEIAGSIRRRRPCVNDIDLVALPWPGRAAELKARCARNCRVVSDGPQNASYAMPLPDGEVRIDLFIARPAVRDLLQTIPGNFGTILLCRTGSKEHNIWMVERARQAGFTWRPYSGLFDEQGWCLAAEEEADIFRALGLDFIPPEQRER